MAAIVAISRVKSRGLELKWQVALPDRNGYSIRRPTNLGETLPNDKARHH
ncbi:hypothetical protein ACK36M_14645 [Aeromonas veronii]